MQFDELVQEYKYIVQFSAHVGEIQCCLHYKTDYFGGKLYGFGSNLWERASQKPLAIHALLTLQYAPHHLPSKVNQHVTGSRGR
jgi:hypothetical protein